MSVDRATMITASIVLFLSPIANVYFLSKFTRNFSWKRVIVNLSIAIHAFRSFLVFFVSIIPIDYSVYLIVSGWFESVIYISPLINIYWIAFRVKSIPLKVLVIMIGLALYGLYVYHLQLVVGIRGTMGGL
jgi:hypothetical protein